MVLWLVAIVISFSFGYWVYRADKRREIPYPWLIAGLRGLLVFLSLLLLIAPSIIVSKNETQKPVVVFLQDNSRSIAHALKTDTISYRQNAIALIEKLKQDYNVVTWGFGNTIQKDSLFQYKQQATDISSALERAQEYYGQQNLGAVIIATDGHFNEGLHPLYQELSLHAVYTIGLGDSTAQKDLRITKAYSNKIVSLNSEFEIRTDISAMQCRGYIGVLQLSENGKVIHAVSVSINADRYDRSLSFSVDAATPGLHHYVLSLAPVSGEENTVNNRRDVFVEVTDEKKNILIAAAAPHPDVNAIVEALSQLEDYKITIRTTNDLPADLSNYSLIILHNMPSLQTNSATLSSLNKPQWFIAGAQTNLSFVNSLQHAVSFNISSGILNDALPVYNNTFSAFTLPQNIQAVMDKMPPLGIPAMKVQATPDALVLFQQRSTNMPLWIFQQGNTPVCILAGEGLWRWRLYEYRYFSQHSVIDECIRQTVRLLTVNANEKPFHVEMPKYVWNDDEPILFNAYLLNANNEQINTTDVQLSITDSSGNKQDYALEHSGKSYHLNIGIRAGGNYKWTAHTNYNGKNLVASGSFTVQGIPLELMETGADLSLLYSLAKKYNGSFVPAKLTQSLYDSISKNNDIKPIIQTSTESLPIVDWKWYFFLIVVVAVTEWLLRKYWLAQ